MLNILYYKRIFQIYLVNILDALYSVAWCITCTQLVLKCFTRDPCITLNKNSRAEKERGGGWLERERGRETYRRH